MNARRDQARIERRLRALRRSGALLPRLEPTIDATTSDELGRRVASGEFAREIAQDRYEHAGKKEAA